MSAAVGDGGGGASAVFGLLNILLADLLSAALIGFGVVAMARFDGSGDAPGEAGWGVHALVLFALAALPLGWTAYFIGWPHVATTRFLRYSVRINFDYCSTHPSYVLLDLLWLPVFVLAMGGSRPTPPAYWTPAQVQADRAARASDRLLPAAAGKTLVTIALARLGFWYGLRRRLPADDCRRAWRPVLMLLGVAAVLALSVVAVRWRSGAA